MHVIELNGYAANLKSGKALRLGTFDSYGIEQIQVEHGPEWDGLAITATFSNKGVALANPVVVPANGIIDVPPGATTKALTIGNPGVITFSGVSNGVQRISTNVYYTVADHGPTTGTAPDPTPSEWEQFVAQVHQAAQQAAQSESNAAASATAAAEALEKVQGAESAALEQIGDAQKTALHAVNQAGETQTSGINAAGQAAAQKVQKAGTEQADAVNKAGDAKIQQIKDINALLPTPSEADAGKAPIAQPDGTYALETVTVDAYTKAESDERYTPIAAAIRPTVSGNPATLEHSVAWAMQGLNVYGRSWQDGTPSVETEVPIQYAGQDGTVDVTVCGVNLANPPPLKKYTYKGVTAVYNDDGTVTVSGKPTVSSGPVTTFFCSDYIPLRAGLIYSTSNDFKVQVKKDDGTDAYPGRTFTAQADYKMARIYIQPTVDSYVDGAIYYPMLNVGDTAQPYQPYTAQQLSIPTPNGLPGIPVDSGGNYTDASSQQWVCDEVDFARGVYVQRIQKILSYSDESVHSPYISTTGQLTTGATVIYVLDAPIETPLSPEELAAYAVLRTYDGTTVVSSDAPVAGLSARYVADGAAYIDGKIQSALAPVNRAILEVNTNV